MIEWRHGIGRIRDPLAFDVESQAKVAGGPNSETPMFS
jgi:hypothetical protein